MATAMIVLAHPGKASLSHLFCQDMLVLFHSQGMEVDTLDLYKEQFDPILSTCERDAYYTAVPELNRITSDAGRLSKADKLVIIFPTWWFGMPAILKGWIDRVFAPTIAFDHANNFGPIKPRLTNLKSVLIVTTLGSPWWVDWFIMRRPVRRILKVAIFGMCAPQSKFRMLSLYSAEKPTPGRLEQFRHKLVHSIDLL